MILPKSTAMVCPICEKPADQQATGLNQSGTHYRFCLYCHECHASVIMDVSRAAQAEMSRTTIDSAVDK